MSWGKTERSNKQYLKNTLNPNNSITPWIEKNTQTQRQDEQVAAIMVATARITIAQINPSYSSGDDDVQPI